MEKNFHTNKSSSPGYSKLVENTVPDYFNKKEKPQVINYYDIWIDHALSTA
jgi:hypothetical protein